MTAITCQYKNCRYNERAVCFKVNVGMANNLHDGAVCMDTAFVNKRREGKSGEERTALHETEHQEHLSADGQEHAGVT